MVKKLVAVITGGSSGIGKAAAEKFLECGYTVYIIGRSQEKLLKAKKELTKPDNNIQILTGDIKKVSDTEKIISTIYNIEKRIDVLVNSAGVSYAGNIENMSEDIWNDTIDTNVKGTYFMCKSAVPYLKEVKGNIVNIGSDSGLVGSKGLSIYCASKGAVNLITKSLALELAPLGIRVNAVCPTETDTPMLEKDIIDYGYSSRKEYEECLSIILPQEENARFVRPQEVAEAIYFLANEKTASAITGVSLPVDFGVTAG